MAIQFHNCSREVPIVTSKSISHRTLWTHRAVCRVIRARIGRLARASSLARPVDSRHSVRTSCNTRVVARNHVQLARSSSRGIGWKRRTRSRSSRSEPSRTCSTQRKTTGLTSCRTHFVNASCFGTGGIIRFMATSAEQCRNAFRCAIFVLRWDKSKQRRSRTGSRLHDRSDCDLRSPNESRTGSCAEEGRVLRYREAPGKLEKAVDAFNDQKCLSFVLSLGDIIDGNSTQEKTEQDFQNVLVRLVKLKLPTFHLLGNHCLRLPRDIVMKQLGMPDRYYWKDIHVGWKLVVLDSMDLSLAWPQDSDQYKEALVFLEEHPLGSSNHMVVWNGGIAAEQRAWLVGVLADAERNGTKLIVASHIPVLRGSAPDTHLMWNCDEIAQLLLDCSSVVLSLCGHYHLGGYARHGSHHFVTLQGVVEAPTGVESHGLVHVYDDQITIDGYGFVQSRILPLM